MLLFETLPSFFSFLKNNATLLLIGAACIALLFGFLARFPSRHRRFIKYSKRALSTVRKIDGFPQIISYLRKLNPFVFEELLLTAFEDAGFKIKRNSRYTGDGGVDGKVKIDGKWYLIQAKRYKSHISRQHINDFIHICRRHNLPGLFIHTGRTGTQSRVSAQNSDYIQIISGQRLVHLLFGQYEIEK